MSLAVRARQARVLRMFAAVSSRAVKMDWAAMRSGSRNTRRVGVEDGCFEDVGADAFAVASVCAVALSGPAGVVAVAVAFAAGRYSGCLSVKRRS